MFPSLTFPPDIGLGFLGEREETRNAEGDEDLYKERKKIELQVDLTQKGFV